MRRPVRAGSTTVIPGELAPTPIGATPADVLELRSQAVIIRDGVGDGALEFCVMGAAGKKALELRINEGAFTDAEILGFLAWCEGIAQRQAPRLRLL